MVLTFIINAIVTYGLGGLALWLCLMRWNKTQKVSNTELLLYAAGMGPAAATLLLYYLLWLLPGQADVFYVGSISFLFVALIAWNKKLLGTAFANVRGVLKHMGRSLNEPFGSEGEHGLIEDVKRFVFSDRTFFLFFILLAVWSIGLTIAKPLNSHDMLIYASQGKVFYQDKLISYGPVRWDEASNYLYIGLHAFSFPLQTTWDLLWNGVFGTKGDWYTRSLNFHYLLLLFSMAYYHLRKVDVRLALLAVFVLVFTKISLDKIMYYSLDTYRLFFFTAMVFLLLKAVKHNDWSSTIGMGIMGGFAAGAHSFGVIVLPIVGFAFLVCLPGHLIKDRLPKVGVVALLFLLTGALHYIIDILWGTGWIFQDIKFI